MTHEIDRESNALEHLTTEAINSDLSDIDSLDTESRLRVINAQDAEVAAAVGKQIPQIARAVHSAAHSLRRGGRLIYIGAGTSGRLGVLDAAECPPTFGTPPEWVQAIIAGGQQAMFRAVEGAEDDPDLGAAAIIEIDASENDTVVGISASGRAPFVVGALRQAKKRGATTIVITNNKNSELEAIADIGIPVVVGPEVLAGSTRMKSGTAQKMVLNMISTGAMMEIGKTYGNLMVDVMATNTKLKARAARIVAQVTGESLAAAQQSLANAGGSAKVAILMVETGKTAEEARQFLEATGGVLRKALSRAAGK
ncbi:N-acetylmuramic acid 6-phosphate etherase [Capsulimonas corticalis]|uniref:N-acetylmuramic acid 6-phosphate etherase n=1 Tax=Capsulimonas corticalis TaxID=2219043 RepID=A0A402CZZ1_9BACT|nr:N-acetylmuramic acid 6-phosphate etherase [Capsulimonas corticalis]BDI33791.1 N-acetylmuramic acid 6-phosphate etherase [Capsulimonas corticalis]